MNFVAILTVSALVCICQSSPQRPSNPSGIYSVVPDFDDESIRHQMQMSRTWMNFGDPSIGRSFDSRNTKRQTGVGLPLFGNDKPASSLGVGSEQPPPVTGGHFRSSFGGPSSSFSGIGIPLRPISSQPEPPASSGPIRFRSSLGRSPPPPQSSSQSFGIPLPRTPPSLAGGRTTFDSSPAGGSSSGNIPGQFVVIPQSIEVNDDNFGFNLRNSRPTSGNTGQSFGIPLPGQTQSSQGPRSNSVAGSSSPQGSTTTSGQQGSNNPVHSFGIPLPGRPISSQGPRSNSVTGSFSSPGSASTSGQQGSNNPVQSFGIPLLRRPISSQGPRSNSVTGSFSPPGSASTSGQQGSNNPVQSFGIPLPRQPISSQGPRSNAGNPSTQGSRFGNTPGSFRVIPDSIEVNDDGRRFNFRNSLGQQTSSNTAQSGGIALPRPTISSQGTRSQAGIGLPSFRSGPPSQTGPTGTHLPGQFTIIPESREDNFQFGTGINRPLTNDILPQRQFNTHLSNQQRFGGNIDFDDIIDDFFSSEVDDDREISLGRRFHPAGIPLRANPVVNTAPRERVNTKPQPIRNPFIVASKTAVQFDIDSFENDFDDDDEVSIFLSPTIKAFNHETSDERLTLSNNLLNQYNFVDTKGSTRWGYKTTDQYQNQEVNRDGTMAGDFGWTSPNGHKVKVTYVADEGGYRVLSSSGIYTKDSKAVQQEKERHQSAHDEARNIFNIKQNERRPAAGSGVGIPLPSSPPTSSGGAQGTGQFSVEPNDKDFSLTQGTSGSSFDGREPFDPCMDGKKHPSLLPSHCQDRLGAGIPLPSSPAGGSRFDGGFGTQPVGVPLPSSPLFPSVGNPGSGGFSIVSDNDNFGLNRGEGGSRFDGGLGVQPEGVPLPASPSSPSPGSPGSGGFSIVPDNDFGFNQGGGGSRFDGGLGAQPVGVPLPSSPLSPSAATPGSGGFSIASGNEFGFNQDGGGSRFDAGPGRQPVGVPLPSSPLSPSVGNPGSGEFSIAPENDFGFNQVGGGSRFDGGLGVPPAGVPLPSSPSAGTPGSGGFSIAPNNDFGFNQGGGGSRFDGGMGVQPAGVPLPSSPSAGIPGSGGFSSVPENDFGFNQGTAGSTFEGGFGAQPSGVPLPSSPLAPSGGPGHFNTGAGVPFPNQPISQPGTQFESGSGQRFGVSLPGFTGGANNEFGSQGTGIDNTQNTFDTNSHLQSDVGISLFSDNRDEVAGGSFGLGLDESFDINSRLGSNNNLSPSNSADSSFGLGLDKSFDITPRLGPNNNLSPSNSAGSKFGSGGIPLPPIERGISNNPSPNLNILGDGLSSTGFQGDGQTVGVPLGSSIGSNDRLDETFNLIFPSNSPTGDQRGAPLPNDPNTQNEAIFPETTGVGGFSFINQNQNTGVPLPGKTPTSQRDPMEFFSVLEESNLNQLLGISPGRNTVGIPLQGSDRPNNNDPTPGQNNLLQGPPFLNNEQQFFEVGPPEIILGGPVTVNAPSLNEPDVSFDTHQDISPITDRLEPHFDPCVDNIPALIPPHCFNRNTKLRSTSSLDESMTPSESMLPPASLSNNDVAVGLSQTVDQVQTSPEKFDPCMDGKKHPSLLPPHCKNIIPMTKPDPTEEALDSLGKVKHGQREESQNEVGTLDSTKEPFDPCMDGKKHPSLLPPHCRDRLSQTPQKDIPNNLNNNLNTETQKIEAGVPLPTPMDPSEPKPLEPFDPCMDGKKHPSLLPAHCKDRLSQMPQKDKSSGLNNEIQREGAGVPLPPSETKPTEEESQSESIDSTKEIFDPCMDGKKHPSLLPPHCRDRLSQTSQKDISSGLNNEIKNEGAGIPLPALETKPSEQESLSETIDSTKEAFDPCMDGKKHPSLLPAHCRDRLPQTPQKDGATSFNNNLNIETQKTDAGVPLPTSVEPSQPKPLESFDPCMDGKKHPSLLPAHCRDRLTKTNQTSQKDHGVPLPALQNPSETIHKNLQPQADLSIGFDNNLNNKVSVIKNIVAVPLEKPSELQPSIFSDTLPTSEANEQGTAQRENLIPSEASQSTGNKFSQSSPKDKVIDQTQETSVKVGIVTVPISEGPSEFPPSIFIFTDTLPTSEANGQDTVRKENIIPSEANLSTGERFGPSSPKDKVIDQTQKTSVKVGIPIPSLRQASHSTQNETPQILLPNNIGANEKHNPPLPAR